MALGTWSDWFEAVGELLAVVVALFLPFIQERRRKRLTRQRISQSVRRLTLILVKEASGSPQWQSDYHNLQTLINLYAALLTDPRGTTLVSIGEQVLLALDAVPINYDEINRQLALLQQSA